MTENIIIAIIGAIVSVWGSASLINWRLKNLEAKVSEHNGYSSTIASMQTDIAVMKNDLNYIKTAIDKLGR